MSIKRQRRSYTAPHTLGWCWSNKQTITHPSKGEVTFEKLLFYVNLKSILFPEFASQPYYLIFSLFYIQAVILFRQLSLSWGDMALEANIHESD